MLTRAQRVYLAHPTLTPHHRLALHTAFRALRRSYDASGIIATVGALMPALRRWRDVCNAAWRLRAGDVYGCHARLLAAVRQWHVRLAYASWWMNHLMNVRAASHAAALESALCLWRQYRPPSELLVAHRCFLVRGRKAIAAWWAFSVSRRALRGAKRQLQRRRGQREAMAAWWAYVMSRRAVYDFDRQLTHRCFLVRGRQAMAAWWVHTASRRALSKRSRRLANRDFLRRGRKAMAAWRAHAALRLRASALARITVAAAGSAHVVVVRRLPPVVPLSPRAPSRARSTSPRPTPRTPLPLPPLPLADGVSWEEDEEGEGEGKEENLALLLAQHLELKGDAKNPGQGEKEHHDCLTALQVAWHNWRVACGEAVLACLRRQTADAMLRCRTAAGFCHWRQVMNEERVSWLSHRLSARPAKVLASPSTPGTPIGAPSSPFSSLHLPSSPFISRHLPSSPAPLSPARQQIPVVLTRPLTPAAARALDLWKPLSPGIARGAMPLCPSISPGGRIGGGTSNPVARGSRFAESSSDAVPASDATFTDAGASDEKVDQLPTTQPWSDSTGDTVAARGEAASMAENKPEDDDDDDNVEDDAASPEGDAVAAKKKKKKKKKKKEKTASNEVAKQALTVASSCSSPLPRSLRD